MNKLCENFMSPQASLWLSWVQLVIGVIGWPISAMTWARNEPQFVLGLSWWAIIVTAHGNIIAARVQKETDQS